jgi:hypothetical protein
LKEEALDHTLWRTCLGRGYWSVVTEYGIKEWISIPDWTYDQYKINVIEKGTWSTQDERSETYPIKLEELEK